MSCRTGLVRSAGVLRPSCGPAARRLRNGARTASRSSPWRLVRVEIEADDDQGRVVRVIPLVVVGLDDLVGRVLDVLPLADDGMAVGRLLPEQQWQDRLALQVPRLVLVAFISSSMTRACPSPRWNSMLWRRCAGCACDRPRCRGRPPSGRRQNRSGRWCIFGARYVGALLAPPLRSVVLSMSPGLILSVPLNIRCSR